MSDLPGETGERPAGPGWDRIALGCGSFGGLGSSPRTLGQGLDEDAALALMDAAWAAGITWFDTADAYAGGRSETIIGRWIRSRGVRPRVTTKTYNPMRADADRGLAPDRIARQLPTSLDRLGLDRVDLYLAHDVDPGVPWAETLGAFGEAQAAGLIGGYGVSNVTPGQLRAALAAGQSQAGQSQTGQPRAVQNSYSLLEPADAAGVIPLCAAHALAYQAFSPLAGGWLTGRYQSGEPWPAGSRMTRMPWPYRRYARPEVFAALDGLAAQAADRGMSMTGLALAWLLADGGVSQIVVGPVRPEHLDPVREALAHPLTPEERAAAGHLFPSPPGTAP